MILSFEKPPKERPQKEHEEMYSSDTGIPGTYAPNMSWEDQKKWKAKKIANRIEIRKSVSYAQVLIVVTLEDIKLSMNGKGIWTNQEWNELFEAVSEARATLNG